MSAFVLSVSACFMFSVTGDHDVRFQAHRGGLGEYPENTMAAYRASWELGALPEVDIRTTKDGIVVCSHDGTLERNSDAPADIRTRDIAELEVSEVRRWDIGKRFNPAFAGEKVPLLEEVFAEMKGHPEREIYMDLKKVDLGHLATLLHESGVVKQVIFCHNSHDNCRKMREKVPGIRTMLWIGGKPAEIQEKYAAAAATHFEGLDQVQLHLHVKKNERPIAYELPSEFLAKALAETKERGIDLEVLPFDFDDASLGTLLDLGIRWYATDFPKRLSKAVQAWRTR